MDRQELLDQKAQELITGLQEWAKGILSPGETLLLSFRVKEVPLIARDADISLLPLLEFFERDRLMNSGCSKDLASRTRNSIRAEESYLKNLGVSNIGEFIETWNRRGRIKLVNVGKKGVEVIRKAIAQAGLPELN